MSESDPSLDDLRARLGQSEVDARRSAHIQAALYRVADAASAAGDMQEFYASLHRIVGDLMYAGNFFIATLDEETGILSWPYHVDEKDPDTWTPLPLSEFHGTTGYVIRTGRSFHYKRDQDEVAVSHMVEPTGTLPEDGIFIPLKVGSRILGALAVQSYTPGTRYTEDDVQILTFVGQHIATALTRVQAIDETRRRNSELAIINSVQQGLASKLDIEAIYELVGEKIRETFDAQAVTINTFDMSSRQKLYHYSFEAGRRYPFTARPMNSFDEYFIHSGRPYLLNASLTDVVREQFSDVVPLQGDLPKSFLCAPLLGEKRVVGYISLQNLDREDAFGDSDVRLLETLTNAMSIALDNARLFDETQRLLRVTEQRSAELAIINSVQEGLASKLDYNAIIQLVGGKVMEIFEADTTYVAIFDSATQSFRFPFYFDRGATLQGSNRTLPLGTGLTSTVFKTRQPLLLGTIEEQRDAGGISPAYRTVTEDRNETYLGVPILLGDTVLGVLSVQRYKQRSYDERQVALLQTLANSMSVALENARLFDEVQKRNREISQALEQQTATSEVLSVIAASPGDIRPVLQAVAKNAARLCEADDVQLYQVEGDQLYQVAHTGPLPALHDGETLPLVPTLLTGRAVLSRQTIHVKDVLALSKSEYPDSVRLQERLGHRTVIVTPMLREGEAIGAIVVRRNEVREFTDRQVALLSTFADQAAIAIENVRLFTETQRLLKETEQRSAELAVINSVQSALAAKLDIAGIYDAVGDKIVEIFPQADVGIRTYDPAIGLVRFPYATEHGRRIYIDPVPLGAGVTSHVLETRQPLLINENLEQEVAKLGSFTLPGTQTQKSALYVPIVLGNEARGLVELADMDREHAFSTSDIRLLTTVSDAMSVALENARLFDETQRLLKETDQRAAELQIINSVQEGLASKLEMQAIYDLVGDKIRQVFDAQGVLIDTFDHEKKLYRANYIFENGQRITPRGTLPFGPLVDHLIATRQPVVINEEAVTKTTQYGLQLVPGTELPKSLIFVPFGTAQQVNGYFSLQNLDHEHAFSESDVRLLQTLAASMGIALENARLFDAERKRAAELAAISAVSQALVAEADLDRLIQLIGDQLLEIFKPDIAYVALLDEQAQMIDFPYKFGDEFPRLRLGEGLTSKIVESGRPLLINRDMAGRAAELGTERVGKRATSFLGVPILVGRSAIGVISVQSTREEDVFNEDDQRLLSTIAANAGAAIQTARLHAETQHRAREMATLAEIGSEIAASRELEPVLKRIATHANDIMHTRRVAIVLRDPEGTDFRIRVGTGPYEEQMQALPIRPGIGIVGGILASGQPEIVNDAAHDPRVIHVPGTPADEDALECLMGVPLVTRGEVIGAMVAWRDRPYGIFTQTELDFLVSVARQTTIAIESARLYLETQRRANEMSALAEVGREISSSLDPTVVLERIAQRAEQLLAAQSSAVFLTQDDRHSMRAIAAVGQLANEIKRDRIELGQGVIGALAKEAKAEFVNDMTRDPRAITIPGTEDVSIERLMAAPLLKGDEVVGMLAVWRTTEPFREADLNFLVGLARQAAIALENARLFAEVEAEKRFSETLVDNSPVAIMSIDDQSRVVAWNPGAERLFGYAADEAVGRNIDELIASNDEIRAEAIAFSEQASRAQHIHAITKRIRKGGSFVDVEISGVPVTLEGRHAGFIGIYHDITELQRARKEAVAANEAKSAFLATMSHEIRTPMNAVIGMSGLLMDTQLSAEQREYAETIRNSGNALLGIINDILDFSKIEAGKMELEHQPFDLRECVESALDLVAARAVEKNLDLAYVMEDEVPTGIQGDVTRLRQILLNLMSNALKFTEHGEVVLTVKRDRRPDHLLFAVRDSGIGIPADRMSRLFESFTQADSSTTRRFGGTGLGLAISKRLAELMDGTMWAESPGAGLGSTFYFTISFEPAIAPIRKASRDLRGIQPALKGKRVLIVDDNITNRRILMVQTQKWGMQPRETQSPREALKWLKSGQEFDVAVLDVQMPEMDGIALTRELRKIRDRKKLPVILLTSLGRKESGARALGYAAYLTKPLKPSALFDALADIFAGSAVSPVPVVFKASTEAGMASRHPLRILLAEDNAVNQKLALRLLEQMGYRADVASNGLEAVESIQRQAYDLVLMDVQMPEMDGLDATRAIRALKLARQPRIVAMTANAMQGDREMCLQAGMDDYLSKPIRVQELTSSLEAAPATPLSPVTRAGPRLAGAARPGRAISKSSAKSRHPSPAKSARKSGSK